ncbi:MAG: hypothetical protein JWN24_2413 [Phycisphaerales bacterium]|jgi:hypothetical protein|nr:hypothetical protein [Phycisphaerales bacterium]
MRRRLVNFFSTLSLLASLALAALWLRQSRHFDFLHHYRVAPDDRSGTLTIVESAGGWLAIDITQYSTIDPTTSRNFRAMGRWSTQTAFDASRLNPVPSARGGALLGFALQSATTNDYTWHRLVIPLWFLILLAAVAPVVRARSAVRLRRRVKLNLCATCGYDLRATPERCPECGTVP